MNETTKKLIVLMTTIQMAYFKGRIDADVLWVHEEGDGASIAIDLYNFGGDGKPVCDGLHFLSIDNGQPRMARPFCISFNPDNEEEPLTFLCEWVDDKEADKFDLHASLVAEGVQQRIIDWLNQKVESMTQTANGQSSMFNGQCSMVNETKTMTLAQAAAQVEGGLDVQIKIGNFDTFADFLTYFNAHYRPMLESMQQGQAPDQKLMGFFIDDMLSAFSEEEQTPSDTHSMGSGDSLSPLTEALQYVRENMDEDDKEILKAEVNKCYKMHLVPNSQLVDCSVVIDLMEEYGSEHDLPESWWEEYADIDEILNKLLEE